MVLLGNALFAMGPADGSAIAGLADFGKDAVEDVVGDVAGRTDIMRAPEEVRHILSGGDPRTRDISRFGQAGSEDRVFIEGSFSNDAALKFLDGCVLFGIAGVVGAGFWFSNPMRYPKRYYPDAPPPERIPRSVVTPGAQLVALEQRSVPTPILPDIAAVLTKEPQDMTPEDVIVLVRGFSDLTMSSAHQSNDWYRVRALLIETLEAGSVESQFKILDEIKTVFTESQARDGFLRYCLVAILNVYIVEKKFNLGRIHEINPRKKEALLSLLRILILAFDMGETGHMLCRESLIKLGEVPSK